MKIKTINSKIFLTSFSFILTSLASCSYEETSDDMYKISYSDLISNYRIVDFIKGEEKYTYIVKKELVDSENKIYGYYDAIYGTCIIKANEDDGIIIGGTIIEQISEKNILSVIEKYSVYSKYYSLDDLGYIVELARKDSEQESYTCGELLDKIKNEEKEKVLVK